MTQKPPNLVLLVLDTVGAGHLSLYGYSRRTSPNLERIAREATVYTQCFAPACWTVPSHASLFTGLYPGQHGAYEGKFILRDNLPHLVTLLQAAGYRTLGISSNGAVSPATGLCPDFDEFHDLGGGDWRRLLAGHQGLPAPEEGLLPRLKQAVTLKEAWRLARDFRKEPGQLRELLQAGLALGRVVARSWLRPGPLDNTTPYTQKTLRLVKELLRKHQGSEAPFFLFVNFLQAHHHYRPPLRWRRFSRWYHRAQVSPLRFYGRRPSPTLVRLTARYTALYDDEIFYLDRVLGRLWDLLKETPGFEDTVVIITSDHGEHLGEKGHYTHILSLYNEVLWVPLVIRYPRGVAPAGRVDHRLVSLTDIYATILDLVDSPFPRPQTSASLLGPPRREGTAAHLVHPEMWRVPLKQLVQAHQERGQKYASPVFAVVTANGHKVIEKKDGELEIYHLGKGMAEEDELSGGLAPEVLAGYRHLVQSWKAATGFPELEVAPS